jgi:hypothetical protein
MQRLEYAPDWLPGFSQVAAFLVGFRHKLPCQHLRVNRTASRPFNGYIPQLQ